MDFDAFKAQYQKVPVTECMTTETGGPPLVSVIVPTYQHGPFIAQALDSFLAQETPFPVEVLVGEDDSSDETREICLEYAARYAGRIRLFLHERENVIRINGRPTGRFNMLWLWFHARGRYVALCEGDDFWTTPEKLRRQVEFLEANVHCALTFHDTRIVDENSEEVTPGALYSRQTWSHIDPARRTYVAADLIESELCPTSSVVARMPVSRALPAWFPQLASGDLPLFLHLVGRQNAHFIPEAWSGYRRHGGNMTRSHTGEVFHRDRLAIYLGMHEIAKGREPEAVVSSLAWHYAGIETPSLLTESPILQELAEKTLSMLPAEETRSPAEQRLARLARGIRYGQPYALADEPEGRASTTIRLSKPGTMPLPEVLVAIEEPTDLNGLWLLELLPELRRQGFQPRIVAFMRRPGRHVLFQSFRTKGIPCDVLLRADTQATVARFFRYFSEHPAAFFLPGLTEVGLLSCQRLKAAGVRTVAVFPSELPLIASLIEQGISRGNEAWFSAVVTMRRNLTERVRMAAPAPSLEVAELARPLPPASALPSIRESFHLVFLGSFTREPSDIADVAAGFVHLLKTLPTVEASLVGNGPETAWVTALVAAAGLGGRLRVQTDVSLTGMRDVARGAHAVAIASDREVLGLPALEALAAGVPLVALRQRLAGSDYLVDGHTGVLIDDWQAALVEVVREWTETPQAWERLARGAHEFAIRHHSPERLGTRWSDLLCRLLP